MNMDTIEMKKIITKIEAEAIITPTGEYVKIATGYSLGCNGNEEELFDVCWRGMRFPKCIKSQIHVTLGFIDTDCRNFHKNGFKNWMSQQDRKELLEVYPGPMESWGYKFLLGKRLDVN